MGMSGDEGRQIADVATKHNQLVMVGHMWRFDTEYPLYKGYRSLGYHTKSI